MYANRHLAEPATAKPVSVGRALGVVLLLLLSMLMPAPARGDQVFSQPSSGAGTIFKSSWYAPDGLDGDEYAFDNFSVAASVAISEIRWRGGYGYNLPRASEGVVSGFTVSIYRSIGGNSQPDLGTGGRLARYNLSGLAGETSAGTIGGVSMYDYHFTLAAPFQAVGGAVYWIQIEASQGLVPGSGWAPDWGLSAASGGNNSHFRGSTGAPYAMISGDLAFSLFSAGGSTVNISATASPANAGVVAGAGAYPLNSTVTLDATANPGWGFVNWTEAGSPVSSNSHYVFTATASRTLFANFAQAFTITTAASPLAGGTTTGDGVYISGSTVTVVATASHGFVFAGWSDGTTTPTYSFPATADMQLTAFFDTDPLSVAFSFDDLRAFAPLPIDDTVNGLTAHLSATGQGYSIQAVGTMLSAGRRFAMKEG